MARIYQRDDIWYLDYTANGKRVRTKVGNSKKVAALALADVQVKLQKEDFGFLKKEITITDIIERFIDYNKTNHRPSTFRRYSAVLAHFSAFMATEYSGRSKVSRISTEVIEAYKSHRKRAEVTPNGHKNRRKTAVPSDHNRGAKSKTINFELDCLKTMFNLGIRLGYITKNPVVEVRPLKGDDKKQIRMLTVLEIEKLLDAASDDLRPILFTLVHTGLRKGELEHLQWRDVDFDRKRILVRPKKTGIRRQHQERFQ